MGSTQQSLFYVILVAAAAPVIARVLPGPRLPQVVFMILGGILIGPQLFDLANPDHVSLFSELGLGLLFLLAGYELDLDLFQQEPGRLGIRAWFTTAVISLVVTTALWRLDIISDFLAITIAFTTTALGTLLPILRDNGMMAKRIGPYIFAGGAVGEFLPIVAMALLLSANGAVEGAIALFGMAFITWLVLGLINWLKGKEVGARLGLNEDSTGQSTLRWTIVLLVGLLLVADDFGIDVVLGAFLAGVVLKRWAPGDTDALEQKLEAVGYGVFIPIFFVNSGMGLDVESIVESPLRLLLFFVLLFAVRGLPALWIYRNALSAVERWQMALLTATALPLLVALTEVGLDSGLMRPENAAALVGAGVLSVMVFPQAAAALQGRADVPMPAMRS